MPGFENDQHIHNGDDAAMTSPTSTAADDDEAILNSSTLPITALTIPITKHHHHHHQQQQPQHQYESKGKLYDPTIDLLDSLPPEILDHILVSVDQTTLLQCVLLSKRWARRVMPYMWYRPRMAYYSSWMKLYQSLAASAMRSEKGASENGSGGGGGEATKNYSNSHRGLGLQLRQQEEEEEEDTMEEQEGNAITSAASVVMATITTTTTTLSHNPDAPTLPYSQLKFTYGPLLKILNFTQLHYILSDTFFAHFLPLTPHLSHLIIDSPRQFSDESLFTLAKSCPRLERLELWGCNKVSDRGMEVVVKGCWMLKAVVVANVVIGSEGEFGGSGGVGNSSRASSSNHSLMLTHKTLDFLAITCPSRTSNQDKEATSGTIKTQRKLHTLNLANGLRFPQPPPTSTTDPSSTSTTSTPPSPHTLSLSTLLLTHSSTLTKVNLSFCGPAVTDSCISNFSPSLLSLNIAFCYEVTDVGLVTLAHTSPGLLHLDITGVTQLSDKGILEIGYGCQGLRTLVMVDERYRSNAGGTVVGTGGGHGGQWCTQNPWITDEVLRIFSWGARIIQRRNELLGQKRSPRIF